MRGGQYLIGLDFGTESARGVLISAEAGEVAAVHRHAYARGVLDNRDSSGIRLPLDWALQDADDYLQAAEDILGKLAEAARMRGGRVLAIGVDFTASTVLPTLEDGTPLSRKFPTEPHAYVKLWKHHSAEFWAERINEKGGSYLAYTGGKTSCEWLPAKAAQLREEAPRLWDAAARFIEAGDWLVSQFVGNEVRSACQAGYKAHFQHGQGYPEELEDLIPGLGQRLADPTPVGRPAGKLCREWVERTGLYPAPTVAVAIIDAHAVVPSVGVARSGTLVSTLGTSACHLLLSEERQFVKGMGGVVRDGVLPGFWGYEAGQAGFGDILAWFVRSFPAGSDNAESFEIYNQLASGLAAGETGLLAVDWWNGCRTPLMNSMLSGMFMGMTLRTEPVELYRSLLESLCFGTRRIVEIFETHGLPVGQLVVTSGLVDKNPYIVQLMADVTGRHVYRRKVTETTARGAAIHGAVAAGVVESFDEGATRLGATEEHMVSPNASNAAVYDELYQLYRQVSEQMEESDVMPTLRRIRRNS